MNLTVLALRFRWLQMPTGLLLLLLQRTPMLRVALQWQGVLSNDAPAILRSAFALGAMGAFNSLAGATTFTVTSSTGAATGAAKANFPIAGTVGTAINGATGVTMTVSGAPGTPKSFGVTDNANGTNYTNTLPPGVSVTPVTGTTAGGAPYINTGVKLIVNGTPTTAGTYTVRFWASDSLAIAGGNSAYVVATFTIAGGGSTNVAPAITTQPTSQTVTAGGAASFAVAASGSPAPTYQWQKGGANIAGATSATYSIASVVAGDAGSYTAVATNAAGSATSSAATLTVNAAATAPAITTQPSSQTVTAGGAASFTVAASGSPTPTFQWQKGGVNIAGATSTTYSIAGVVAGDAGNYTAVATNSAGTATSSAASLTVSPATVAPAITTQPSSQTAAPGALASFTVVASGNPAPSYQWQKGGVNIAGATSTTYSIAGVVAGDAGNYTVVATNSVGAATSSAATLTVSAATAAPAITSQPTNVTVTAGGLASFTVAASGNPAPSYQWQKGGVNIAGATSATYSIASVVAGDAGNYSAVATNTLGTATSSVATLTVSASATAPAITTQPTSQAAAPGAAATFTVAASGNPAPTYQWQKGGVNIAGAMSATYSIASVVAGDAGNYTAVATNSAGSVTSVVATLTVSTATVAPAITTQPTSQTAAPGAAATFTVAANGNPAPTYQWQKGGVNITGATSATYSIASVVAGDAGNYTAVATNSVGTATSSAATLTVSTATSSPTITTQPANSTVAAGGSASFTVAASGNPAPTYQWYFGGAAINGATSATLSLSNVQAANAGDYYATAVNNVGTAISTSAKLTVPAAVVGTLVPSQLVAAGHDVVIAASGATGAIQWQVSSDQGSTWQNLTNTTTYTGVTSSLLEILKVSSALNGSMYRYVSTATGGVSTATTLSVVSGSFLFPTAVSTDSAGNLYVSDASAQTVQKINTASQISLVAGTTGQIGSTDGSGAAARFNQPGALVAAPDGTLHVSDTANSVIRSITASGNVTTLAGTAGSTGTTDGTGAAARFSGPVGIARDASGSLFMADSQNHTIRKVSASGVVTTVAGTAGSAGSVDGTGASARFNLPTGVAVDAAGNVYVSDAANNTIRKISSTGVVTTLAGLAGSRGSQDGSGSTARFSHPGGLALGTNGDLYLADTENSTIRKITPAGVVTTIAGLAGMPGLMDGSAGFAWFAQPEGLTLGGDGNLYVADTGNAMIRKVTLAGAVTTVALTIAPAPTPTPTPAPSNPSSSGTGSGGGGGAPSVWFSLSLVLLYGLRCRQRVTA